MTSAKYKQIVASLHDKEYRDLFVEEEINTGLPFQIRAIRQAREWSQKELAERVGMAQEGISRLESLNYGKFTLSTLKRVASAFDVALIVRFVPFSELAHWITDLSPENLAVPDFDHDPGVRFEPRDVSSGVVLGGPELDSNDIREDANRLVLGFNEYKQRSQSIKLVTNPTTVDVRDNKVVSIEPYLRVPYDAQSVVGR